MPIHITTVRRAMIMLFIGAAKAVDPETYATFEFEEWSKLPIINEKVKTPRGEIRSPTVVVLLDYNQMPIIEAAFSKKNIYRRDGNVCQYCARHLRSNEFSIDHVKPTSKGGLTSWENCVLACKPCNHNKGDRTPTEANMKLLKKPKRPKWISILAKSMETRKEWQKFI